MTPKAPTEVLDGERADVSWITTEELDRICSAFVETGVRKLRITGGEPLVRRDIMSLFRSLSRHLDSGALDELTLTTNGSQLARYAAGEPLLNVVGPQGY